MGKATHIVRKQIIALDIPERRERDYAAIADAASRLGRDLVPGLLDTALDGLANGRYERFDHLAVTVELAHPDELEEALRDRLPGLLRAAIADQRTLADLHPSASTSTAVTGPAAWLLFYLEKGHLPWSAPNELTQEALTQHLEALLLSRDDGFYRALHRLLVRDDQAMLRFLRQFGWRKVLSLRHWRFPDDRQGWSVERVEKHFRETQLTISENIALWRQALSAAAGSVEELVGSGKIKMEDMGQLPEGQSDQNQDNGRLDVDPVYVQDAGLVLLHPFLSKLLGLLGCLGEDGNEVVEHDRAATILAFLANGETSAVEWELVMAKALLGIKLNKPLGNAALSELDKMEATQLLESVIRHWSVLGQTSVQGLRESFLLREGRLTEGEDHWQLKVAQRSYDLLLDQLPWGIQVVRLPWMLKPLYVEWT